MMTPRKIMTAVLLAMAGAGCSSPFSENEPPYFQSTVREVEQVDYSSPGLIVSGGDGEIVVRGETWTGCTTNYIAVSHRILPSNTLALVVTEVQDSTGACLTVVTPYEYEAEFGNLEAGRYHLQVLYNHSRNASPPRTVFHDFVTVR